MCEYVNESISLSIRSRRSCKVRSIVSPAKTTLDGISGWETLGIELLLWQSFCCSCVLLLDKKMAPHTRTGNIINDDILTLRVIVGNGF